ncbi:hypothetical protein [Clostridium baratii]|nr:hypothetical protein [Clostridium baratii]MDY3206711.1 hypothetical protein [Clostridium baratii]
MKIIASYKTLEERKRIIATLSIGVKINNISKEYDKGKYKRIYIDIE